ncbi:MAG TPA: signal peptidase II [Caldilineaceae bacterium]|nr:signal peptidase II [Caldilineaceae bacterium]
MKFWQRLLLVFFLALALDVFTKLWVERALTIHTPVPIMEQMFQFTLSYNTGVAFGLFANGGTWPLILSGVIIAGLAIWVVVTLRSGELPSNLVWPLAAILGGAIANFSDRLFDGRVTDFLDIGIGVTRWPTFNLADTFIVTGVALLALVTFLDKPASQETSR